MYLRQIFFFFFFGGGGCTGPVSNTVFQKPQGFHSSVFFTFTKTINIKSMEHLVFHVAYCCADVQKVCQYKASSKVNPHASELFNITPPFSDGIRNDRKTADDYRSKHFQTLVQLHSVLALPSVIGYGEIRGQSC